MIITIDIETRSDVDLAKAGVYKYAESKMFDVLLFSYSVNGSEIYVVDTANGEKIPKEILSALSDEKIIKRAFNVNFERICLSRYLGEKYLSPVGWQCSMIHARTLSLPSSLAQLGEVLGIEKQKMAVGKSLIKHFCVPDSDGHFNAPTGAKWEEFKIYNKRDVEAEMEIDKKLSRFPVPDELWQEFYLDQQINDRGILVDMELVEAALTLDGQAKAKLTADLQKLTGLENPNSVTQMKEWIAENGLEVDSLEKKEAAELLKTAPPFISEVLTLRSQLAKSSVSKYKAMKTAVCSDNRARGMLSFYGASRSGRFSGRIIQLQNLPQNHIPDLTDARETVKHGYYDEVEMLYDDVPDTLSQLIRTAFIPKTGCKFIVADFSAIEARVIAWLAGEQWRIDAFKNGEDIYCASASKIYGVPVVKHGENGHLRQKGKVAELACGYGGSVGAMKAMGGSDLGLIDAELKQIVTDWRNASPHIVQLWWDIDEAAKAAVTDKATTMTHGLTFSYESGFMFIRLPSGRRLAYAIPKMGVNKFGSDAVTYMGITTGNKWARIETYGPKLTENIVQGIARDLLVYSMKNLSEYRIVAHVHDEVIIECPKKTSLDNICTLMSKTPEWAEGLLLRADGYECEYYRKD